jgi:hypothetical protein
MDACANIGWAAQAALGARFDQTGVAALSSIVYLFAAALRHDMGTALGGIAVNRRTRSRIARYSRHGIAASANWRVTQRVWRTILLPILTDRHSRQGCHRMADIAAGTKIEESSGTGFGQVGHLVEITKEEKTSIRTDLRPMELQLDDAVKTDSQGLLTCFPRRGLPLFIHRCPCSTR